MSSNSGNSAYRSTAPPAVETAEYAGWQRGQQSQRSRQSGVEPLGAVNVSTPGSSLASPTLYDAPTASAYGNSRSSASTTSPYAGQGQPYDRAQYGLQGEQGVNSRPGYDVDGEARSYREHLCRPRDSGEIGTSNQGGAIQASGGTWVRPVPQPNSVCQYILERTDVL
ncbi:MAG: hypothetical protein M1824_000606 [Vezdaea acicularis]|nr:MAG: hypothetical protein M1824_000606 [Vezdaea acicularis]